MPMIQGIDGGLLINALRQGREDRFQDDARAFKMEQAKAEAERQRATADARRRALGLGGPQAMPATQPMGGVMGQFTATPGQTAAPAMGGQVADMATAAPQQGMAPTRPAMGQRDNGAFMELLALDPEGAGQLAATFKNMDEAELKRQQSRNDFMGASARYLSRIPPTQRPQAFARLKPQMIGAGWTEQELANVDLSDEALMGYQAVAIDFDKIIDNDLAERKFRAGDNVSVQPEGSVINIKPVMDPSGQLTGTTANYVVKSFQGGGEGAKPDTSAIPEPAKKMLRDNPALKQEFDQKYGPGSADAVLGGAGGNTSGSFPG